MATSLQMEKVLARRTEAGAVALVVDDDWHMRELLVGLLRDCGFAKCAAVATTAEALQALVREPVVVALVDLRLAGEEGTALIAAIREHALPSVRALPVVVVSGAATEASVRNAARAGADAFIAKPLSTATFRRQISFAMERDRVRSLRTEARGPSGGVGLSSSDVFELE